ncbi:MAG: carboxyl-terminal protease, partial [Verrucomicrobiaceae bacterium]|nr:carboxyl-terminal protease [Verrucomicrobiaceae bacterium]
MTLRTLPLFAVALFGMSCVATPVRAETDFGQVAIYVAHMLENQHYSHKEFDNDMSSKLLENYLNYLDARHTFFTQEDVDKFRTDFSTTLDDHVMLRNVKPATEIYEVYKKRVKERVDYVKQVLGNTKFTFDSSRTVDLKREKLPWPKDKAAADTLWHDLIESEMLQEHLSEMAKTASAAKKADRKAKKAEAAKDDPAAAARAAEKKEKAAGAVAKTDEKKSDKTPVQRIIEDYERLVDSINENNTEDIVNFFLSSLATAYDPHTEYMSQQEMDNFNVQMKHSLFGIGALLGLKDDAAEIQGIVMGGPADKE